MYGPDTNLSPEDKAANNREKKNQFFEKTYKNDETLARVTTKIERRLNTKIRNES